MTKAQNKVRGPVGRDSDNTEFGFEVVHVVPSLALRAGGPAVCVAECAAAMLHLGVQSRVFATDLPGPPQARRQPSVSESEFPPAARALDVTIAPVRWPRRFAFAPSLRRSLEAAAQHADLVNIHSLFLYPQFAAWRAAVRAGTPYVVTVHGALDPYLRRRGRVRKLVTDLVWQRRMLNGAAALQFATIEEAQLVGDIAPSVPRIVVPLGVDAMAFRDLPSSSDFRNRRLGGHDGPVVLALGRLAQKKGLDILICAFAGMSARHPDAVLVLAGPDDEGIGSSLQDLAESLGVAHRVFFPGMLFREERLEALSAATVWALPSHTENFAIAALEALAAGVPVILSPAVNLAPRLEAEQAAIVADATPEAFGRAIDDLLSRPDLRAELSQAGREFAWRYDWSEVAVETAQTYAGLLSMSPPSEQRLTAPRT